MTEGAAVIRCQDWAMGTWEYFTTKRRTTVGESA